jgi:drug/metabolite transporter (DMT)-like permease
MGEWAALAAALIWTVSSLIWGKIHLSAAILNFAKNGIGSLFLGGHLLLLSLLFQQWPQVGGWASAGWLALSSLVGIAIGDTFFFRSLQILGPRLALMMATTAPLFGAAIGWLCFGEWLSGTGWLGIGLTLIGVVIVVSDRRSREEAPGLFRGSVWAGVGCGLGGAVCQAVGGGLSKQAMQDCGELEATALRTAFAFVLTFLYVRLRGEVASSWQLIRQPQNLGRIVPAAGLGTWLGIWLSQIAFNQSPLAIALTLMATSPLFAIPLVYFWLGHRVTHWAIVGSVVAIGGVYLVGQARVSRAGEFTPPSEVIGNRVDGGNLPDPESEPHREAAR